MAEKRLIKVFTLHRSRWIRRLLDILFVDDPLTDHLHSLVDLTLRQHEFELLVLLDPLVRPILSLEPALPRPQVKGDLENGRGRRGTVRGTCSGCRCTLWITWRDPNPLLGLSFSCCYYVLTTQILSFSTCEIV